MKSLWKYVTWLRRTGDQSVPLWEIQQQVIFGHLQRDKLLLTPLNTKDRDEEGSSLLKGHRNSVRLIDRPYNRGTVRKWRNNAVPRHRTSTHLLKTAVGPMRGDKLAVVLAHTHTTGRWCVCSVLSRRACGFRLESIFPQDAGEPFTTCGCLASLNYTRTCFLLQPILSR